MAEEQLEKFYGKYGFFNEYLQNNNLLINLLVASYKNVYE